MSIRMYCQRWYADIYVWVVNDQQLYETTNNAIMHKCINANASNRRVSLCTAGSLESCNMTEKITDCQSMHAMVN